MKVRKLLSKLIASSFVLVAAMLGTGCTISMFSNYSYNENISSILISQDKKKIVVISEKFHYIFDAPPTLINTLESPIHSKITASFDSFKVTKDNAITGTIQLHPTGETSDAERAIAKELGFYFYNKNYKQGNFNWMGYIKGTRYSAKEFTMPTTTYYKLSKPYVVRIEAERTTIEKWLRAPLTPITVALDGAIALGAIVLAPILIFPELHRHN
jgi:hypothetical protein